MEVDRQLAINSSNFSDSSGDAAKQIFTPSAKPHAISTLLSVVRKLLSMYTLEGG